MLNWIYSFFRSPDDFPQLASDVSPQPSKESFPRFIATSDHDKVIGLDTVKLLSHDLDAKDRDGNTPLILAAAEDNYQAIEMLFQRGADLNVRGHNGFTALNVAAQEGKAHAAMMLISLGADLELRSQTEAGPLEGGSTPLWTAVRNHHLELVRILVSAGADVNVLDGNGNSVLSYAVYKKDYKIVELLVAAQADPFLVEKNGMSAINRAKANNQNDMLTLLEEKISQSTLVRQRRLQHRYFDGQSVYNPKPDKQSGSTNKHLTVTRPTLM